ncbi:hypothetical protein [Gimesia sp.]|uniref:hypothetical protein n=1 Tax=Gimesia sp. TaxID=2024833 RepID=UPI003A8D3659
MKSIFLLLLMTLPLQGCFQGTGANESEVSGVIKLDGEPLPEGTITFISADNTTHSAQGKIQNGEYQVTVPVGEKRVEIHASRWTGKPYKKYDIMETEQYLPAIYNEQSQLTADVKPAEDVQLDFELDSSAQKSGK